MQEINQEYTKMKCVHIIKRLLKICMHSITAYKYLFAYAYKFN